MTRVPDPISGRGSDRIAAADSGPRPGERLVIAAVRPYQPNFEVIRVAAEIATREQAELLILATVPVVPFAWAYMVQHEAAVLEPTTCELFGHCVEVLYHHRLVWGVRVEWGYLAAHVRKHADSRNIRALVLGSRRPRSRLRRLAQQFAGNAARALPDRTTVV